MINLWTTPRTGSHWYAKKLAKDCNGYSLHEFFSRNAYLYYFVNYEGRIYFLKDYREGSYYLDYSLDENGRIIETKVYGIHSKRLLAEEKHRLELIRKANTEGLVLSNHVFPIDIDIYNELSRKATRNIFLRRRNIREQISSYCIAHSSRHFVNYGDVKTTLPTNLHVDKSVIDNIALRIKFWRDYVRPESEIIDYEDIDFTQYIGNDMPTKQSLTNVFENLDEETKLYVLKVEKELS